MPMVELFLRERIEQPAREQLAEDLTRTILQIEAGEVTEAGRAIAWVLFNDFAPAAWAVGGKLNDDYRDGHGVAFARITVPEASLDPQRKDEAVAKTTSLLRKAMGTDSADGTSKGIWVHIHEVPEGHWGALGKIQHLRDIGAMTSEAAPDTERSTKIKAYLKARAKLKEYFGFPH